MIVLNASGRQELYWKAERGKMSKTMCITTHTNIRNLK